MKNRIVGLVLAIVAATALVSAQTYEPDKQKCFDRCWSEYVQRDMEIEARFDWCKATSMYPAYCYYSYAYERATNEGIYTTCMVICGK